MLYININHAFLYQELFFKCIIDTECVCVWEWIGGLGVGWPLTIVLVLHFDITSNLLWQHPIFILSQYEYEMFPSQLKMNRDYDLLAFSVWWKLSGPVSVTRWWQRALTVIDTCTKQRLEEYICWHGHCRKHCCD